MSSLGKESGEPLVQWASFTLHQDIIRALDISTLGIVCISSILEGGNGPLAHLLSVLWDVLSSKFVQGSIGY